MLSDMIDLNTIIISFENILQVDQESESVDEIVKNTHERLENKLACKIDKSLYELQVENKLVTDTIALLLSQIQLATQQLAFYKDCCIYTGKRAEILADVSYLGFAQKDLENALKYLQHNVTYKKRESFFNALKDATTNMQICQIKRLLIIMYILEDLGIEESVAVIAMYLYMTSI